ncbi:MAG TPA: hypothetical protein VMV29_20315 [Ktedonobacterales bacterium]|nr:hypothetical protein [Ktedonobacterales bacterium]
MAGQVTIVVTQQQYGPGDTIEASVANGLPGDIRVADHQSGCTILTVERQAGSSWQAQNPCLLRSPTRLTALSAGSVTPVGVQPPPGGWARGLYRAILVYREAAGDVETTVMSAAFRVV